MIDFEKLKRMEKEKKLFAREYRNVNYWQMIRLNFVKNTGHSSENSNSRRTNAFLENIVYCIKNFIPDLMESRKKHECDLLYFDQCSYRKIDGDLRDPYFDYFEFEKKFNVYRCYYLKKYSPKAGVGIALPLLKYYFYRISSKICKKMSDNKEEIIFLRELDQEFKKYGSQISVETEVDKAVCFFKAYKPFYDKLLSTRKPKAVFVLCHYDEILFPLYQSCMEKRIPVIELQHGLASGVHAYTYEDLTLQGKQLPSHIFTYGELWNNYIKMPNLTKVVPIGNAFLENRKEKYTGAEVDHKKVVIYSFPDERDRLVDLALYIAENLSNYQILLKLHPREMPYYQDIQKKTKKYCNLEIVDENMELYELLSSAAHHIAISSTVLYEASIFNSMRYVYSRPKYIERMQPLIDAGLAIAFHRKEDILELIERSGVKITHFKEGNPMWKMNAKENAFKALIQIMNV